MRSLALFSLYSQMLPRALEHIWMATEMSGERCSSLQLRSMSLGHLCSSFLALERSNHGLMDHTRVQKSNLQSHPPILRQKNNMHGQMEAIVVSENLQIISLMKSPVWKVFTDSSAPSLTANYAYHKNLNQVRLGAWLMYGR